VSDHDEETKALVIDVVRNPDYDPYAVTVVQDESSPYKGKYITFTLIPTVWEESGVPIPQKNRVWLSDIREGPDGLLRAMKARFARGRS